MNTKHKVLGFTLIDQMIVLSIIMMLIGQVLPSISSALKKNQISSIYNEMLAALNYTRSIAVTTGSWATLCKSNQVATACATSQESTWNNGWIVFVDRNKDGVFNKKEKIYLQNTGISPLVLINYSRTINHITYGAEGYAVGYNGKISFCDVQQKINKTMVISNSGRIRLASKNERGLCQ